MEQAIQDFAKQFSYEVVIENAGSFKKAKKFILGGMGGSALGAGLLKIGKPSLDLIIHRDYGLPFLSSEDKDRLFIASSYSGNTEETLDFAAKAKEQGLNLAVIATGGKLIEFAKANRVAYVQIPNTGIQPRSALGFSLKAISKLLGNEGMCDELALLSGILKPEAWREEGKKLAGEMKGKVPVIYSSNRNKEIAYNWKIKCNETGKIPAFYNVFPELNHNEMTSFDVVPATKDLSSVFHFIFIIDDKDDPRVGKRMKICENLYKDRGFPVTAISLLGPSIYERIFNSLMLADWTAFYASKGYGTEAEQVPMVEEFKKLIG